MKFKIENSIPKIVSALSKAYGKPYDQNYIEWLSAGPHGPNTWYVAVDGEKIVAVYGMLPGKACVGGVIVNTGLANNAGVDPKYRGVGLFRTLGLVATESFDAELFVGASNDLAIAGHKKAGWRERGGVALMRGNLPLGCGRLNSTPTDPDLFAEDVAVLSSEYDFFNVRCCDWFFWRFSKPGQAYKAFSIGDHLIVWKEWQGRAQVMILRGGVRALRMFGGAVDVWAVIGSNLHKELKVHGFDEQYRRHLIFKPGRVVTAEPESIRFELCDNDVY